MSASKAAPPKITPQVLLAKKQRREPIAMLTAYDCPTARALDLAGIDVILVGDSVGMVVLGYDTTLPVTMEDMLHHCKAVARGARRAHLVGDMPFMSYQASISGAVRNAGRFIQEAGMEAVKVEGGRERAPAIRAIAAAGIPVMGHLGLTPQSVRRLGGWKAQATSTRAALRLIEDAHILEHAGCYALVLESIPDRVAELVRERLEIPVLGIGAGSACDGQVLVTHDMLGLFSGFTPRFVKKYADLNARMSEAFHEYIEDVRARRFPAQEHRFTIDDGSFEELLAQLRTSNRKLQRVR